MKILVCISKVPDTTTKITFKDGNKKLEENGIQWIINPYDEWYALVKAIELKEADAATTIHILSVGDATYEPILRKALALGGDEALRIEADNSDSFYVACQIAHIAQQEKYDLIFTGKESIDYNGGGIGGMIAERLQQPYFAQAASLLLKPNQIAEVVSEVDGGEVVQQSPLPIVLSCQKGMANQRIPNMRGIMAARTKSLKVLQPLPIDSLTEFVQFELPPAKQAVHLVDKDNVAELVRLLHEEAKVF